MAAEEAILSDNANHSDLAEPYAPSIEEHIDNQDQKALMKDFTRVVDQSTYPDAKMTDNGIHAPTSRIPSNWYRQKLGGWLYSHLVPAGFQKSIEKEFGNFVIIRSTGKLQYEEMPLYTRIGMHLLFGGYYVDKVDNTNIMHALFLRETVRQGQYFTQPESVKQIPSFVQHYMIEMKDFVISDIAEYKNFNEFFTRSILPSKRPIAEPENNDIIVAAADSRLNVFNSVDAATTFWIKGKEFTLAKLLQNDELANELEGGSLAIFRLAPQDYHRYHAPIKGKVESIKSIAGTYYTVNPCTVNKDLNVFTDNHRSVIKLKGPQGFSFAFVAIGALLVGSIVHTHAKKDNDLEKGQEMGYFQYGGSTVIAVFPKDTVVWDKDLLTNSEKSIETVVHMGERIGTFQNLNI